MLDQFQELYVFKQETPLRIRVDKIKEGKHAGQYYLMGDSCTCPGYLRKDWCKHRQMWAGDYVVDEASSEVVIDFTMRLMESLGLPWRRPEGLSVSTAAIGLNLPVEKIGRNFDKCIGTVKLGKKTIVVEIGKQ